MVSIYERIRKALFNDVANYMKVSADKRLEVVQHTGGNFALQLKQAGNVVSEGAGSTTRWTYTVPTGKVAKIKYASIDILCEAAATTTTSTHRTYGYIAITPTGKPLGVMTIITLQSAAMAPGNHVEQAVGEAGLLEAGDEVRGVDEVEGAAGGAGRAYIALTAGFDEYDA